MSENTGIVILTHKQVESTFLRHLWLWERHTCPIIVVSSGGFTWIDHPQIITPHAGHDGEPAYLRIRQLFRYLAKWTHFDQYVIFEWDSFCVSRQIPKYEYGVHGISLPNDKPSPFPGDFYPMLPYGMDRNTVVALSSAYEKHVLKTERWYGDRTIGELSRLEGIPIISHGDVYFCRVKITSKDYPEISSRMKANGLCWFHGVKDEDAYNFIVAEARKNGFIEN